MVDVFVNVILPTFAVVACAAVLHGWRRIPVGPLSQTALYLLTPALVFTSILNQRLPAEVSLVVIVATLVINGVMLLVGWILARLTRQDRATESAFLLATGFPNAGNLALPILQLTFGEEGLAVGVAIFVTQAITAQSLGILVAARSEMSLGGALLQVIKLPATYAVVAAVVVKALDLTLPFVLMQPITLLSDAAIPVMLVVLGFQIGAGVEFGQLGSLAIIVATRLLASAPLAYVLATVLGIQGVARAALVIVAAIPVAVFTTILAQEFKANPRFVTNVVIASTALSMITLTVVISAVTAAL